MKVEENQANITEKPSLFGVLLSPKEHFQRMRENPRFVLAFITVVVLSAVFSSVTMWALVQNPAIQEEMGFQGETELPVEMMTGLIVGSAAFGSLVGVPIAILLTTLFHWLLVMLFQGNATYRQILSLNSHLNILPVISSLIYLVVVLATGGGGGDPQVVPTSLAAFIPAEGFVGGLLAQIEVFAIWQLVLTAGGLSVIGGLSKGKGWAVALIVFGAGLLLSSGMAAMGEVANSMNMNS
ncbi:Yip1 family protein [Paludifilum halophilum]|uniref:Yip1 domain-containing protein n=1 Tax=Paludifilum halophilum TaxID=1642702 RepID=A0A235B2Q4_9BACL|nr:Yip1 family protein [Paludifilum halophilum]OYD06580.1 hypothetical protein CHM34_15925 [Paludifilum halophilum]